MGARHALHPFVCLLLAAQPAASFPAGAARDSVIRLHAPPSDVAPQENESERAPDDVPMLQPRQPRAFERSANPDHGASVGPNVRMNSLIGSPAGNGEAEVSIAAIGARLVSAWNDGRTFGTQPGFVGFGYSTTGGQVWFDGGSLPLVSNQDVYYGDPVMAADPASHWYVADLYEPFPGISAISVNHGTFTGTAPVWNLPVVVASSSSDALDKPWIAVDPASGTVYCAWTRFTATGQEIEFSRSLDHGATWSPLLPLTSPDSTATMSSRLTVGPNGELDVAYSSYSLVSGFRHLGHRRSIDQGLTWGPEHGIGGRPYNNNYYSGPAGFNRERVVALVSLAVDRSSRPTRGRLHAVWHEMLAADEDPLGTGALVNEVEPDDVGSAAVPFTPGASLRGALASGTDQDWWSFTGSAGQTFVAQLAPVGSGTNGFLRLFAGGFATANRCAFSHFDDGTAGVVFTLPSTGTYWLRVLSWDGLASSNGAYRIDTAWHTPRPDDHARDHRDVMTSHSDDGGVTWSAPVDLSDAPPGYDETFPEVAVDANARVYAMWYDHREDAANGILTTMRARISVDGGEHWSASERVDDAAPVNWNLVTSNMYPNMGDYSQLVADGTDVHAVWADGRGGTPDAFYARITNLGLDAPPPLPSRLALSAYGPGASGAARVRLADSGVGTIRLELFDVLGRRLDARVEPAQGAPRDVELGRGLGPGVYLVRAIEGAAEASARAIVLR